MIKQFGQENSPGSNGRELLDRLRSEGRPDSEGHFTVDYEKKNARAWEAAQTIEGAMDKVGFEIICDAVRDVLGDIDKSKKPRKWNYHPEKELRDAHARTEAARWAERLSRILLDLNDNIARSIMYLKDNIQKGLIIAGLVRDLAPYRRELKKAKPTDGDPWEYARIVVEKAIYMKGVYYQTLFEFAISHPECDWIRKEVADYPQLRLIEAEVGGISKKRIFEGYPMKKLRIGRGAKDMINSGEFKKSPKRERLSFIQLTVGELGFGQAATLGQIYARAKELGLELCPPDAGPNLAFVYGRAPGSDFSSAFYVGMRPMDTAHNNHYRIFEVEVYWTHEPRLNSAWGDLRITTYGPNSRFVFVRPTVKPQ